MNCDLQTCLHVLESGSINEDSFREVLNLFHGFSSHTELVDNNRVDTATVYCRILRACQNLYEIDTWEKLPKDAAEQLIQSFNNIERLYHNTSEDERKGTYIRTIWFLSELKTKAAEGRTEEIDKGIIGEYAKDLLDVFQDIRFVFDIETDGKRLFPISQVIAAVIRGQNFQKFRNGIQIDDIYTLRLAVKLFQTPEDTEILEELKSKYRLKFIDYLREECLIIDTSDFLNYQWNRAIIFYNDAEHKVLIRSLNEDYFSQCEERGHKLQTELDCDDNPIGYFVEYVLDTGDELCDYSDVLRSEVGRINFLRLVFDRNARNVFLEKSIVKKSDGSLLPINPYCTNDTRLVQGYLGNKKGKAYPLSQIRELLQKYRACFIKTHIMNRVTLGLCIFLLDTNNIGVDALGLGSLAEDDWYQNQVIQNWLNGPNTTKDHISLLLNEWYRQLSYCEKILSIEKEEFHTIDFLPLRHDLNPIYQKIYPDSLPDEKLFSGGVKEDDELPDNYTVEVNDKTVAGANEKKLHHLPIIIQADVLRVEDETLKWDQRVGGDVYFFYSRSEEHGCVLNRELLKALAGVELVQQNCLRFEVGAAVTGIQYNTIQALTRLFETTYSEVANKTKACLATDLDIQTYLRLLHNMIWTGIDTVERMRDYFSIFRAHQIADFSEIDHDPFFQREAINTLYVPKDSYHQSSVLSFVYEKRLKPSIHRDNRHLYNPELSMIDGQYAVFGSPIERIVFLTDNFASGFSTIAALAACLGIDSDKEYSLWSDRVKKANITRQRYRCGDDEDVSVADIIRTNNAKITVHSYYGTSDASNKIDEFLEKHNIPFEKSSYCQTLSTMAEQDIIERAKSIWSKKHIDYREGFYLYVREYNMPRKSIFPSQMLEEPRRFINLFARRKELNELKASL